MIQRRPYLTIAVPREIVRAARANLKDSDSIMAIDQQRARALFVAALEVPDLAARSGLLERECGSDAALRQRVEELLSAHDTMTSFDIAPSGASPGPTIDAALVTRPGALLAGRYKLIETIGEGGMGSVWMAEQRVPVRRQVAVKLVKAGMDTKQVLARFEAERQALAVMDHPNIAKIFDGGMTEQGRPYFVMEYVKGVPLTEYCDQARLSLKERLQLFRTVCQAVQHAHQKGIIHRDLKPSNILISFSDGKPVPKVIDFGLAKAMHQSLTEQSLYTTHGMMVGTPLYMSPEQAEHDNLDVDTRTDIYSLGVILYELLTGSTPLERRQMKQAAYHEILRLIKEVEPPKPSTRLSSSQNLPSIAAQRKIEPHQLKRSLTGDLDWIVMKALDKERSRRYETANGLARDVERFLSDEAVEACPPSQAYRFKKFILRNRGMVTAVSAVAAALVIATGVSVAFAMSEARQRAEAQRLQTLAEANATAEIKARTRAEAINEFVITALESSDPMLSGKQDMTIAQSMANAIALIESGAFKNDPETEAGLKDTIGHILKNNGQYSQAQALLEQALATREQVFPGDHPDVALSLCNLASLHVARTEYAQAEPLLTRSLAMFEKTKGPDHSDVAACLNSLGALHYLQGQLDQAEPLFLRALAIRERSHGPSDRQLAVTLNDLALLYSAQGKYDQAEPLLMRALAINEQALGPEHPDVAACLNSLATMYVEQGLPAQAEPLYTRALSICESSLGPDHPLVAHGLHNLAKLLSDREQFDRAEPMYLRALAIRERVIGPESVDVAIVLNNLALMYKNQGRHAESEPLYLRTLSIDEKLYGPDHPEVAHDLHNLAALYESQNELGKADESYQRSLAIREKALGPDHVEVGTSLNNYGLLKLAQGRHAEAEPLSQRAVAIYRQALGPDHPNLAQVLTNCARIQQAIGKSAESRQGYDEALAIVRKHSPDGSTLLARILWRSGAARLESQDSAAALPELEEAVRVGEKLLPPESPQLKEYRETLAKCKAAMMEQGKTNDT